MDISILEFIVYGIIAYSSLLMLIISTIKDTPATKSQSLIRSIYMIPGIICAILLAGSGVNIVLEDSTVLTTSNSTYEVLNNVNSIVVLNSTVSESVNTTNLIELQNPIWVTLHYMIALIMFAFVITRILQMLMFKE